MKAEIRLLYAEFGISPFGKETGIMNRKTLKIVSAIIAGIFIFGLFTSVIFELAYAETSVQQKLNEAQKKKKDAQSKLNNAKQQKTKSLAEKERLENEAVSLQAKIDSLEKQVESTKRSLNDEEQKLANATEKAETQYRTFQERFRVMCEQGNASYLDMLLSSKSFKDFVDKAEIIKEIAAYDKGVFDRMEESRKEIEQSRNEIKNLKDKQEGALTGLEQKRTALKAKQQQQADYIKSLESDAAAYQKVIDEEDRAMEALKAQIASSLSKSTGGGRAYVGGEFLWPTPSCYTITSSFSPRRKNPVSGVYKRHTGTDIGARYGASVVAANSGTVTLAGWNSGYGNCVIIDHGGGRATLYGHLSSYSVSKGQSVNRGQGIGRVGSTGNSTGPHLHFEVLINGSAVDAMQYFK